MEVFVFFIIRNIDYVEVVRRGTSAKVYAKL